jgi:hypothetical protein
MYRNNMLRKLLHRAGVPTHALEGAGDLEYWSWRRPFEYGNPTFMEADTPLSYAIEHGFATLAHNAQPEGWVEVQWPDGLMAWVKPEAVPYLDMR